MRLLTPKRSCQFRTTKKNNRISFSFLCTAFSERIICLELNTLRKKRRRDARKRTMSALGVRGELAYQREISAVQRIDGISPPYGVTCSKARADPVSPQVLT
jgi:hypothetical protein